jgi:glycerate kinase
MFNVLISPDSFKGSARASSITEIIEKQILRYDSGRIKIEKVPLADGGEGSLESISQVLYLEEIHLEVCNPLMYQMDTFYLYDKTSGTAYIEMAKASGLSLVSTNNEIMMASSFGTGQLIKHAISLGASKIVVFLGGSATCDAGMGICDALGINFYDSDERKIFPFPSSLKDIRMIDTSASILKNKRIQIVTAVDVNNSFYGETGASYTYSPQKGANPEQVRLLDEGLQNIAGIINTIKGIDLQNVTGSGAAGGSAGGLHALFDARIVNGSEFIFDLLQLEEKIKWADLIISGEGKIDHQTLNGKLLFALSRLTAKYNKRLWAVCGIFEGNAELLKQLSVERVFALASSKDEIDDSIKNVKNRLEKQTIGMIKSLSLIQKASRVI